MKRPPEISPGAVFMSAENANAMLFLWSAPDLATIWRTEHTLRQETTSLAWWHEGATDD